MMDVDLCQVRTGFMQSFVAVLLHLFSLRSRTMRILASSHLLVGVVLRRIDYFIPSYLPLHSLLCTTV